MNVRPEDLLLETYDRALGAHGDSAQGAIWPNEADRRTRFDVMLDVLGEDSGTPVVLCDLGCGTGELLAHIRRRGLGHIVYRGIDRSRLALEHANRKFPGAEFVELDVTSADADLNLLECDYLVSNGLFTGKLGLSYSQMWTFLETTLRRVWPRVRRGIAFNVMSKSVDWERDDLFHVPMDDLAKLLHELAGRRLRFRADYGLYEYTAFAFKQLESTAAQPLAALSESVERNLPVLRPRLPSADRLLPYLKRIDQSRIYSNFGPLVTELESRLASHFGLPLGTVTTASSGHAALLAAILASTGRATPKKPLALIPAYTFIATAAAVEQAGYQPFLVDVDPENWLLDPQALMGLACLDQAGLVVPVAAYGRPIEMQPWLEFRQRTGIEVVIDGAAAFDTISHRMPGHVGALALALSFHATKAFGTGEGGAVLSTDAELVSRAARALNFGFSGSRDCASANTNGKMSEYHAAVGLAEFDGWESKLQAMRDVAAEYRYALAKVGLAGQFFATPDVGANYALLRCRDLPEATRFQAALRSHGIDFRLWYGLGLHHQSYYTDLPRGSLAATDQLAPCLLGLPFAPDMGKLEVSRVAGALADATGVNS